MIRFIIYENFLFLFSFVYDGKMDKKIKEVTFLRKRKQQYNCIFLKKMLRSCLSFIKIKLQILGGIIKKKIVLL